MRHFLARVLLFLSPLLLLLAVFLVTDPFGLYGRPWARSTAAPEGCSDCMTMRAYDEHRERWRYNAFILGNSKTLAILSTDWAAHIGPQRFFKFGTPGESLLNIRRKLEHVEALGDTVEHAILVLDTKVLMNVENTHPFFEGPVYMKSLVSSDANAVEQLSQGFRYYLADGFFARHLVSLWTRREKILSPGQEPGPDDPEVPWTNEFLRDDLEQELRADTAAWVSAFPKVKRSDKSSGSIDPRDRVHLQAIRALFERHGTRYHVVFGPTYECTPLAPEVLSEFNTLFGGEFVHDFTADPALCGQPVLFYEPNHYRPAAGRLMLEQCYGPTQG